MFEMIKFKHDFTNIETPENCQKILEKAILLNLFLINDNQHYKICKIYDKRRKIHTNTDSFLKGKTGTCHLSGVVNKNKVHCLLLITCLDNFEWGSTSSIIHCSKENNKITIETLNSIYQLTEVETVI